MVESRAEGGRADDKSKKQNIICPRRTLVSAGTTQDMEAARKRSKALIKGRKGAVSRLSARSTGHMDQTALCVLHKCWSWHAEGDLGNVGAEGEELSNLGDLPCQRVTPCCHCLHRQKMPGKGGQRERELREMRGKSWLARGETRTRCSLLAP